MDVMPVPEPGLTKVKFNIRAGVGGAEAWDLLLADDPEDWLNMSRHRERHQNNNLDRAEYLLAFAQYYPYGPQYFIFGGFFRVRPVVPEIIGGPGYELTPLAQHSEYIKRLIIKLERPVGRDLYLRWYETLQGSKLNPESTNWPRTPSSARSPATRTSGSGTTSSSASSPTTSRAGRTRFRA
jgi:hypothetical protein